MEKGLRGLKFMQRGEEKAKEQLQQKAQLLLDQIKEDQEFVQGAATKFSKKPMDVKEVSVARAAKRLAQGEEN